MRLPISIAEKLILLQNGEIIPFSKLKHSIIESMIDNGIVKKQIQGRSHSKISLLDKDLLNAYLKNHFGIDNLGIYIDVLKGANVSRADSIEISSNSKLRFTRTFKGFLVNCYQSVSCKMNGQPFTIQPQEGTFTFIYDFENFIPDKSVTIVGIENSENFRYIQNQSELFKNILPLFVSRYPQNLDLIKWLKNIPNDYLHFADFDYAGINIYINEYKRHLENRAQFFLPVNIESLLSTRGNRDNYFNQKIMFDRNNIKENNVLALLKMIEKYKKGLEQEIFVKFKT